MNLPPSAIVQPETSGGGVFRGSPRARGYNSKWDRLSIAFRRRHPFCRMCEQEGRDGLGGRVDHIKPQREYPQLMFEWKNLQNLCTDHDNLKQQMENLARKTGQLELLPLWCSSVEARPKELQIFPTLGTNLRPDEQGVT